MKKALLSLVLCLSLSANAVETSTDISIIADLFSAVALKPGIDVSYIETKFLHILDVPLVNKGTLRLDNDGSIIKQIDGLNERLIISETEARKVTDSGEMVFTYTDHPQAHLMNSIIRAIFLHDIVTLNKYFKFHLEQHHSIWHLKLVPVEATLQQFLHLIEINGYESRLEKIEILQGNGDKVILEYMDTVE
ncbi:MAG: hypothetical protein KZQ96_02985 [Candidatus Thiodiazotropha sp. (ex Lucinoma borealis)]|nr:hypothetical protein [Candidatus Thiodiazotropha sp. (ex Lucinoma borealis)]MCU7867402.1 hypothetical protein [Candidatus Thiodiazotropha sp. (ex Lucinoma borealis)]